MYCHNNIRFDAVRMTFTVKDLGRAYRLLLSTALFSVKARNDPLPDESMFQRPGAFSVSFITHLRTYIYIFIYLRAMKMMNTAIDSMITYRLYEQHIVFY